MNSDIRSLVDQGSWQELINALDLLDLTQRNDAQLWWALAVAHRELGQAELGFAAFAQALDLDPTSASLRLEAVEALLCCQEWSLARQLLLQPEGAEAAQNARGRWALARCTARLGDPHQAELELLSLQQSSELDLQRLGVGLAECNVLLGDLERARFCLDRLFELDPYHEDGTLLELELFRATPPADCVHSVQALLDRLPQSRRLKIACADFLFDWKQPEIAGRIYQAAIEQHGLRGRLVNSYVRSLVATYQLEELRRVRRCSDSPYPMLNFDVLEAKCLMGLGLNVEAKKLLAQGPQQFQNVYLLCQIYRCTADLNHALRMARQLQRLAGSDPDCCFDAAVELLALGEWEQGWNLYEHRFFGASKRFITPAGIEPRHSQDPPNGKQVIVFSEQGIGDSIMMASMLPDLQASAQKLTVLVQPRLEQLFRASFPDCIITTSIDEDRYRAADSCYGLGSLGQFFRTKWADFPGTPFLSVGEQQADLWKQRLQSLPAGARIGVAWSGGGHVETAKRRSIPLLELLPIFQIPGITWVNLQYNHDPVELRGLADQYGIRIHHFDGITKDLLATAALSAQLDLVITVQQSAAHIAGAIGTPTWVLVPLAPEWRYGSQGSDMPWYGSVELFRQSCLGDWSDPIELVRQRLIRWRADACGQNEER